MAQTEPAGAQDSPFWRFSLRFYRNPDVAAACIALQDEAGVDVNILLFLLWNATLGKTLSAAAIEDLERQIGPWRSCTVIPLRELRRALKSPPPVVAPGAAEALRTRIKATELEAERVQQQTMYELAPAMNFATAASPLQAARANVAAYRAAHPRDFPPAAVETILEAFARQSGETAGGRPG